MRPHTKVHSNRVCRCTRATCSVHPRCPKCALGCTPPTWECTLVPKSMCAHQVLCVGAVHRVAPGALHAEVVYCITPRA